MLVFWMMHVWEAISAARLARVPGAPLKIDCTSEDATGLNLKSSTFLNPINSTSPMRPQI